MPGFDARQKLAHHLGMAPRSVQIWFQNRRQRLLKPSLRGDGGEGIGSDELGGVPEGDPTVASATHCLLYTSPSPRD